MESAEELQEQELTVLRSIYGDDFSEPPAPKVWKGASRLPEFLIRVCHPDELHVDKIFFHLNVKFPKTYPNKTCPIFTIQKPTQGISAAHITKLSSAISAEAQRNKGSEMVFQIVTFAQDWLSTNVVPPAEVPGSLATQMTQRTLDEEQARKQREAELAEKALERAAQEAEEFSQQLRYESETKKQFQESQYKARRRAESDATAVPSAGDVLTESFDEELEICHIRFNTVKVFHPRKECLGMTYLADPVCDDVHATLPLELYCYDFFSPYYSSTQGRKKLKQLESDVRRLTDIRHPNLLSVFAVKLTTHASTGCPRLTILSEQRPSLSLQDVLEDCESLREERTSDYISQILSALKSLHDHNVVHRGISPCCIFLEAKENSRTARTVKLGKSSFYVQLQDLHRSNPFGSVHMSTDDSSKLPEAWMGKQAIENPLEYTTTRDIYCVGIVLLQMLSGHDVVERFVGPEAALSSASISSILHQLATAMLFNSRKSLSCASLLAGISDGTVATMARTPSIPMNGPKTPTTSNYTGSPEMPVEYFKIPTKARHTSRWKEDWEELELLGKGAFGSVVKARNKIDSRIYAVKKVRLRTTQSDSKIFREVNALSRLSHRFVVRYYTTWVETSEVNSSVASSVSNSESDNEEVLTSVPDSHSGTRLNDHSADDIGLNLGDLDDIGSHSYSSFPSIHFSGPTSNRGLVESDESDSDGGFGNLFVHDAKVTQAMSTLPPLSRTLYIQMEFVERQTLKERVAEGLSEDEAWRLFQQILDALVHMSSLGILHRDIKLTNIFIDGKGDCKVGDFGLATSSLAAVDPTDVSQQLAVIEPDMTLEVGTKLYIAPEVLSRKRGPRNHTKADMYSLGIVFFEMNYTFSTSSERIAVLENLRKSEIIFPNDWDVHRTRQRQIIVQLLQHDPAKRPTALELSQSPLVPPRMEDEYFRTALRMMSKPDSPHHQALLASLFGQSPKPVRSFLYDSETDLPEHASLNHVVQERLAAIFRLHGAVDMEPPLLMPLLSPEEQDSQATFIDKHGDLLVLPNNALVPFARLAARTHIRRIKRYHIANIYRPNSVAGHPKVTKAAVLDVITPDLVSGPAVSAAEMLSIIDNCLDSFPGLAQAYEIHISHSQIVDIALSRVPCDHREAVVDIVDQSKSSISQKRALLLKRGLLRSTADELEVLADIDLDMDALLGRLEKVSPALMPLIAHAVEEIKETVQLTSAAGISKAIYFHPLMLGSHHSHFKDGVRFEVVRSNKRLDVLAAGGRYDQLIHRHSPPKPHAERICAFGVQIALEKITVALAAFQSSTVKNLIKEQRSFGFWSPRRCDVYVVSYHPGYLPDRLEVAALLWQHNISADIMYESGLPETEHESYVDACAREGILFTVYPRPRSQRREQLAFKVKSILKGTEYEVSRQELVGWLQQQIAEQKRVDAATSGARSYTDSSQSLATNKDAPGSSDIQLMLPGDTKKQKKTKQLFLDRAFDAANQVKSSMQNGMPMLAVDVSAGVFTALTKSSAWIMDDDAWRTIISVFPTQHSAYAHQIRENVTKRKAEGHRFMLLFAVRDERIHLLTLS